MRKKKGKPLPTPTVQDMWVSFSACITEYIVADLMLSFLFESNGVTSAKFNRDAPHVNATYSIGQYICDVFGFAYKMIGFGELDLS